MRKGPFNAVIDPTEVGAGSALLEVSEAVKKSGSYDVWTEPQEEKMTEEIVGNAPGKKTHFKVCPVVLLSQQPLTPGLAT